MTHLEKARAIIGVFGAISVLTIVISLFKYGWDYWVTFFTSDSLKYAPDPAALFLLLGVIFTIFFGFLFYILNVLCKDQWD